MLFIKRDYGEFHKFNMKCLHVSYSAYENTGFYWVLSDTTFLTRRYPLILLLLH